MAVIPIRDVPGDPVQPSGNELVLIDNGIAMQKATIDDAVTPKATQISDQKIAALNLGSAAQANVSDFATAAQGQKADSAVQPGAVDASGFGFVLNEDDLASDSTSKLPTQHSVKAYVDAKVGAGPNGDYESVTAVQAANIPQALDFIRTAGYYSTGDGGAALYKRVSSEPSHAGKIQSADGAWWELAEDVLSVSMFGARSNGTDDDTSAFIAAASLGKRVRVPKPTLRYRINGRISLANGTVFEGDGTKPEILQTSTSSALTFDLTGLSNARIVGLKINGNKASVPGGAPTVLLSGSQGCAILDNEFINLPAGNNGCIRLSEGANNNEIAGNTSSNADGNFIGLIGSGVHENRITNNLPQDCNGFGIFVAGGAYSNLIAFNKTTSNGIELIGITRDSNRNRVIGNHAEGCGDNGISVTGDHNIVVANTCIKNDLAGIFAYGSFNTVVGNTCTENNQVGGAYAGIGVQAVFGGLGQYNIIEGNILDDDQIAPTQNNCIRVLNRSYSDWATGVATTIGTYIVNGTHLYISTTAGTTGTTPPTHTNGTASDGGVSWQYVDTFLGGIAQTAFNIIGHNSYGRYAGTDAVLFQSSAYNILWKSDDVRIGGNSNSALRIRSSTNTQGAIYFNDGGDAGWIRYSHNGDLLEFGAGAATALSANANRVVLQKGFAHKRTLASGATYPAALDDEVIGVSTSSARTVVLPASGRVVGMTYTVKDETGGAATNNITVNGNGATIDGAATYVINTNYGFVTFYWTGSMWAVTAKG